MVNKINLYKIGEIIVQENALIIDGEKINKVQDYMNIIVDFFNLPEMDRFNLDGIFDWLCDGEYVKNYQQQIIFKNFDHLWLNDKVLATDIVNVFATIVLAWWERESEYFTVGGVKKNVTFEIETNIFNTEEFSTSFISFIPVNIESKIRVEEKENILSIIFDYYNYENEKTEKMSINFIDFVKENEYIHSLDEVYYYFYNAYKKIVCLNTLENEGKKRYLVVFQDKEYFEVWAKDIQIEIIF